MSRYKLRINKRIKHFAEISYKNRTILINPKKGEIFDDLAHEELHLIFPDWEEWRVRRVSQEMVAHIDEQLLRKWRNDIKELIQRSPQIIKNGSALKYRKVEKR